MEEGEESDDVLSYSKKSHMVKTAATGKGKEKAKANGKLPFKALPTSVKISQIVARGKEPFGKCLVWYLE